MWLLISADRCSDSNIIEGLPTPFPRFRFWPALLLPWCMGFIAAVALGMAAKSPGKMAASVCLFVPRNCHPHPPGFHQQLWGASAHSIFSQMVFMGPGL